MRTEAKQILLGYAQTAGTESNIVATADIDGCDAIFIGIKGNVGTANDAGQTMSVVLQASIAGGTSTSYTTYVSTSDVAAWAISSVASTNTEKSLLVSRQELAGRRYIQITVHNDATDTSSESFLSVVGLMLRAGTAADYVA